MFVFRLIASFFIILAIFGGLLFIPAGTLDWPRGWIFVAVTMVASAWSSYYVLSVNRDLLAERMKPPIQKGQPTADKVITVLFLGFFYALIAFIPLDVFHLHLLGGPGKALSWFGLVLYLAGWWIIARAMRENAFAAIVVRSQKERGQHLIDTGPYALVRHPMYSGAIPFALGMPLFLGSYAGALFALIPVALMVIRIFVEEKLLIRELGGYADYMTRVRYRLVPYIW